MHHQHQRYLRTRVSFVRQLGHGITRFLYTHTACVGVQGILMRGLALVVLSSRAQCFYNKVACKEKAAFAFPAQS